MHSNIGSRFSKEHFACYMTFQPLKAELKDDPILKFRLDIRRSAGRPAPPPLIEHISHLNNNLLKNGNVYLIFPDFGHLLTKDLPLLIFPGHLVLDIQHRQPLVTEPSPAIYLCGTPSDYEAELLFWVINLPTGHGGDGRCQFLIGPRDILLHRSLDGIEGHPVFCFEPHELRQRCTQAPERSIRR